MVSQTFTRMTMNIGGKKPRRETLEGIGYYVVPVSMLAEGVWDGSNGKLLYRKKQLRKCVPTCNHKPLILYHPDEGKSGCDPSILETRKIGLVLNASFDKKLDAEAWVDEKKANALDTRIMTKLKKGEVVECSTGLFFDPGEGGTFKEEEYVAECLNIAMDHLAVLPDKIGAFSAKAGGGLMQLNEAKTEPERVSVCLMKSAEQSLECIGAKFAENQQLSFSDISRQLADLLASTYGEPGKYWAGCVVDVYSNKAIFRTPSEEVGGEYGPGYTTYMIGYSVSGGVVSLKDDATEVERVTEYVAVGNERYSADSENSLVLNRRDDMAFDRKAHIASLIKSGGWEEDDRTALEGMSDAQLQKIKGVEAPVVKNAKNKKKVVEEDEEEQEVVTNDDPDDDDDDDDDDKERPAVKPKKGKKAVTNSTDSPTIEDVMKKGPSKERQFLKKLFAGFEKNATRLIKQIVTNEGSNFTEDELKKLAETDYDMLEKIARVSVKNAKRKAAEEGADEDEEEEPSTVPIWTLNSGAMNDGEINKPKGSGGPPLTLPPSDLFAAERAELQKKKIV